MKVLIINTTRYTINGIANVIVSIINNLKKENLDLEFTLTCNTFFADSYKSILENKVSIVNIPPRKKLFKYMNSLKKMAGDYDIIHVHGNSYTMLLELVALRKHLKKVIIHGHATKCSHPKIHSMFKGFLTKLSKNRVACSEDAGKFLYSKNFDVLPNGIDLNKFVFSEENRSALRKENDLEDKLVFLHIGSCAPQKNQKFLIDVIKSIPSDDKCFIFLGDGPQKQELLDMISEEERKYIRFLGAKSDAERYYSMADFFVLPSIHESFGLVLLEAQINGVPCIASNTISKSSLVINDLVTYIPLEKEVWVERLQLLIPQLRKKVDLKLFENFDITTTSKRVYKYYLKIHESKEN